MNPTKAEFNALLRADLTAFIQKTFATVDPGTRYSHNWHIEAIAWNLEQCVTGEIKRLIITLPPRSLKSIITSVAFPAWVLGHDPTKNIICASYSQNLANKHALDCRAVMESLWYQACFPGTQIHQDKTSVADFMTSLRGSRFSTSVGGTLTGRGGNLIIIDDPHKAEEGVTSETNRAGVIDWYSGTLSSRLNNKKEDAIILIQQRLHQDDLAGYLLETGEWEHLNLPAIAEEEQWVPIASNRQHYRQIGDLLHPALEPQSVLDGLKRSLGSYNFAAQYQQRPAPMGGGLVKWDWFQFYDKQLSKEYGDQIVQSWDTACKADVIHDWSVCTTWLIRENKYYLLNIKRQRLEFAHLKQAVIDHAKHWDADRVLIEDKGAGISLIQDLRRDGRHNIIPITPEKDKATRMLSASPLIESGKVLLPANAAWLADFQTEIVNFPKGKHDDQVDSLSQFLNWVRTYGPSSSWATIIQLNEQFPNVHADHTL